MKEKMNKTGNTEEKILGILLEGPKTNTELLTGLGYNNKQHGNISKLLNKLNNDEIIVSKKIKSTNIDDYCTEWSIISKYTNLRQILEKHQGLIYKMQKSDLVLDSICDIAFTHTVSRTIYFDDTGKREESSESPKKPISEEGKKDLKFKMMHSLEFFKYILLHDTSDLSRMFDLVEQLDKEDGICNESLKIFNNKYSRESGYFIEQTFKACVHMDILKGKSNPKANEYLIKIEQERRDVEKCLKELKG